MKLGCYELYLPTVRVNEHKSWTAKFHENNLNNKFRIHKFKLSFKMERMHFNWKYYFFNLIILGEYNLAAQ